MNKKTPRKIKGLLMQPLKARFRGSNNKGLFQAYLVYEFDVKVNISKLALVVYFKDYLEKLLLLKLLV
jgi:hypothetical protein